MWQLRTQCRNKRALNSRSQNLNRLYQTSSRIRGGGDVLEGWGRRLRKVVVYCTLGRGSFGCVVIPDLCACSCKRTTATFPKDRQRNPKHWADVYPITFDSFRLCLPRTCLLKVVICASMGCVKLRGMKGQCLAIQLSSVVCVVNSHPLRELLL